jgi:xanthine dehydrogenase YagR molybdenum-binding subunit
MNMQRIEWIWNKVKRKMGIGVKTVSMPYGIAGYNLKQIKREVFEEEPLAWPVNDALNVVGKSIKRIDGYAKVTGSAKYTSDIRLPGMLYGKILRSHHPHARIKFIDTLPAENYPGVMAVHIFKTLEEYEENNKSYPEIRYVGQPIAGIAAQSKQIAEEAVKLIKVEFEYLPFVTDLEDAMKSVKSKKKDIRGPFYGNQRGDIQKGFAEAEFILEQTYKTQVQHHCCLETHSVVVDYQKEGVTIYASTQSTKNVRDEFSKIFDLPQSKVRVICEYMGGGFGSKQKLGNYAVMAGYLSKKSGFPVLLTLDRKEEFIAAGNRPNSIQHLKIGAKKNGILTAIELHSSGTAGVASNSGVGNIAESLYFCPNFYSEHYTYLTNAGPALPFRAPGNVQGCFSVEQLMDELAEKLQIDPILLRERCDKSEIRKVERSQGAEKFGWHRRKKAGSDNGHLKRGMGMAQATWHKFVDYNSSAEVRLYSDGGIEVRSGVQDIGTGTKTVLAQVVAEELGVQAEDITVRIGDTLFPDGPTSSGSQTISSITPAVRNAAYKAKQELFELLSITLNTKSSKLNVKDGYIFSKEKKVQKIAFKDALKQIKNGQISAIASRSENYDGKPVSTDLGCVQFAEVIVDIETGFIKVEKIVSANSCGRPINIAQIESQIEGAVIQGLSYALYENRVMDNRTGIQMNSNMHQYKLPFSMDIPEIDIILVESYNATSSTDAVGIGEPPIIATAPAIANAVYNAIGIRINELPITPDKILNALKRT